MEEEVTDEEIERLEDELKQLESKDSSYGSPSASQKDSLFRFFRTILSTKDTTRIGNVTGTEIGISDLSVRGWKRIALYARKEGLDDVASYLDGQAEIMTATSMSKDGFWSKNFVTQIKKEQKVKESTQERKKWFQKKAEEGE